MKIQNIVSFLPVLFASLLLAGCSAEVENYSLELQGDWPEYCVEQALIPRNFRELGQVGVSEEFCLTYKHQIDEFTLTVQTISEDELRFWMVDADKRLIQLSVSSNHPCEEDNQWGASFYTYLHGDDESPWLGRPDEGASLGIPSAVVLLSTYLWRGYEEHRSMVARGEIKQNLYDEFCYHRPAPNPITVVIEADAHDVRVEIPVAVRINGYDLATIAI